MQELDAVDFDRRLEALLEISASQSQSIGALEQRNQELAEYIRGVAAIIVRQGEQIGAVSESLAALERTVHEHGRQIDRQIDAIFLLLKEGDESSRRIARFEERLPGNSTSD